MLLIGFPCSSRILHPPLINAPSFPLSLPLSYPSHIFLSAPWSINIQFWYKPTHFQRFPCKSQDIILTQNNIRHTRVLLPKKLLSQQKHQPTIIAKATLINWTIKNYVLIYPVTWYIIGVAVQNLSYWAVSYAVACCNDSVTLTGTVSEWPHHGFPSALTEASTPLIPRVSLFLSEFLLEGVIGGVPASERGGFEGARWWPPTDDDPSMWQGEFEGWWWGGEGRGWVVE